MPRSAAHEARNKAFREGTTNNATTRANSIPTALLIPAQAQELGVKWEVEDVPHGQGGRLHWVGDRTAKKIILYFHGGGFALPIFKGNVHFFVQTQRKLKASGKNVVLAFLEYSLTPTVKYPTQYVQGIQALRHVLSLADQPSDVSIGGGSAGGNLVLAVISSILHPHPDVPPLTLSSPLKGAFLISPWVTFSTEAKSFKENQDKDMYNASSMAEFATDFATQTERSNYTEPKRADVAWWKDMPVENVLMVAGEEEMFRDDITSFADTLTNSGVNLEYTLCPEETHVECTLEAQFGMEPGHMSNAIWDWLERII